MQQNKMFAAKKFGENLLITNLN